MLCSKCDNTVNETGLIENCSCMRAELRAFLQTRPRFELAKIDGVKFGSKKMVLLG